MQRKTQLKNSFWLLSQLLFCSMGIGQFLPVLALRTNPPSFHLSRAALPPLAALKPLTFAAAAPRKRAHLPGYPGIPLPASDRPLVNNLPLIPLPVAKPVKVQVAPLASLDHPNSAEKRAAERMAARLAARPAIANRPGRTLHSADKAQAARIAENFLNAQSNNIAVQAKPQAPKFAPVFYLCKKGQRLKLRGSGAYRLLRLLQLDGWRPVNPKQQHKASLEQ